MRNSGTSLGTCLFFATGGDKLSSRSYAGVSLSREGHRSHFRDVLAGANAIQSMHSTALSIASALQSISERMATLNQEPVSDSSAPIAGTQPPTCLSIGLATLP